MNYTDLVDILQSSTIMETNDHLDKYSERSGQTNESASDQLCGLWPTRFGAWYGGAHGFVALFVCLIGCILNILNLIVLKRCEMQNPTNTIFSGLAFADFLNHLEYIPFALFMKILARPEYPPKTFSWAVFVLFHSIFSQVCHTISIWLTVTLAVWRYLMVSLPIKSKTICTMKRATFLVGFAYVSSLAVCIPIYFAFSIKNTAKWARTNNVTVVKYFVHYSNLAQAHDQLLVRANFWIYSVVIKLIPCIVLTIVSLRLIHSLIEAKKRKARLMGLNREIVERGEERCAGNKTTRMLLVVLVLFLMTEFPQGILGLISSVLGESFFHYCYLPLGDLMDIVALTNSAINFIKYRKVLYEIG